MKIKNYLSSRKQITKNWGLELHRNLSKEEIQMSNEYFLNGQYEWGPIDHKTLKAIAYILSNPPELEAQALLLKMLRS